jgi:hypothetical protein
LRVKNLIFHSNTSIVQNTFIIQISLNRKVTLNLKSPALLLCQSDSMLSD